MAGVLGKVLGKDRYVIEVDGKKFDELQGHSLVYPVLFGIVKGISEYNWIKIEEVEDSIKPYKKVIKVKKMREIAGITRVEESTIIVKEVGGGDEDGR